MDDASIEVPLLGTPRESDELHREIQEHILKCQTCQNAIAVGPPRGFGQRGRMCETYWQIQTIFSQEGPPEKSMHNA